MERRSCSPPKRKACDFCYRRKAKCDGQQPRCSNCERFKCDCTYKAASRKVPSRKQAAIQRQHREFDLQSRVESLECQLKAVLEKVERLEKIDHTVAMPMCIQREDATEEGSSPFHLPPYRQVLPIIEHYLATFNVVLPLFAPATLLSTVQSWYRDPNSRDPVVWAVINVVLALAHHTSSLGDLAPIGDASTFLNNTQSVLTEVTMRETHLVNIQVILGLVMLFWTADDLGPALILVGTALRLAHKLGLNLRTSSDLYSPSLALQRNRVFWIAYILDRDISLQSGLAPVQLEGDIDLDLPPVESKDDLAGFIFCADGYTKMNFFRARVELAKIQGAVYNCVYSAYAQNLPLEERAQRRARIVNMLDEWRARIPPDFHPMALLRAHSPGLSRYLCILYSTSLSCRALISFASASDSFHYSEWMKQLQEYGGKIVMGRNNSHAPVPPGWQALADASREYMGLSKTVTLIDPFFTRITLCAHNSSLISLIANRILDAHHPDVQFDKDIIERGMKNLDNFARETTRDAIRDLRDILGRLCSYADVMSGQSIVPMLDFWGEEREIECLGACVDDQYRENDALMHNMSMPGAVCSDSKK
ncbi:fungal-specific transcription factor domain-containing protein [Xylaria sp. FL1042]|nr:fungal-specific transcription factor domain-containing protein [Xylaria sp. FL1042]